VICFKCSEELAISHMQCLLHSLCFAFVNWQWNTDRLELSFYSLNSQSMNFPGIITYWSASTLLKVSTKLRDSVTGVESGTNTCSPPLKPLEMWYSKSFPRQDPAVKKGWPWAPLLRLFVLWTCDTSTGLESCFAWLRCEPNAQHEVLTLWMYQSMIKMPHQYLPGLFLVERYCSGSCHSGYTKTMSPFRKGPIISNCVYGGIMAVD